MPEVYVSTDIEADGPIPGPHSMLSFASAAFIDAGVPAGTFSANLHLLPGRRPPRTRPRSGPRIRPPTPPRGPTCGNRPGRCPPTWRGSTPCPAGRCSSPTRLSFDFTFVYWYLIRFAGRSPFSHSALDVKTFAMALLKCGYRDATKRNMPRAWFGPARHTHVALDDAIEQGELFRNMLAAAGMGRADRG